MVEGYGGSVLYEGVTFLTCTSTPGVAFTPLVTCTFGIIGYLVPSRRDHMILLLLSSANFEFPTGR